jgi:hypothetical protein
MVVVVLGLGFVYLRVAQSSPVKGKPAKKQTSKAAPKTVAYSQDVFCVDGNYSPSHPLICVGEGQIAKPNPANIYDVESDDGKRSSRHVRIHWFAQRTVALEVTFKTPGCVEKQPDCDHLGHCQATVGVTLKPGETRHCTYSTKLYGGNDPDEEIIINPCCP